MDKIGVRESPAGFPKPKPLVPAIPEAKPLAPPAAEAEPAVHGLPQPAPLPAESFRSRQVADIVTGSLLGLLGVLVIGAAVRMGIGWGSDGPQGGFVPFWLAIILVLCSASIVVKAIRRASREKFATRGQLACVLQVMVPATSMILLIPYLGLYVAGAVYTALYMRWGGRYSWAVSLTLPVFVLVLFFLVFERWFLVPLPKGPLEAWLGF